MKKIMLTDYVANFLAEKNIETVFAVTGASAIRLIDSVAKHPAMNYVCPHHEQAGVMAAIGYFRKTNQPGVMIVTAGPGATNALTGVASAYLDSIPLIVLAGQEKTEFLNDGLRGKGVQGLPMAAIAAPVTKKSYVVTNADEIDHILSEAYELATKGRPGPVWIDIPQDVQNKLIEEKYKGEGPQKPVINKTDVDSFLSLLSQSHRPLIWVGHGVRLAKAEKEFLTFVEKLGAPVLTAWNGADLLHEDHACYVGRAGIYGNRSSNFVLQNCDLLICLGTRLAIPQRGYAFEEFAPFAKKVIVEIDPTEISKLKLKLDLVVNGCVGDFLTELNKTIAQVSFTQSFSLETSWWKYCHSMRAKYPVVTEAEKTLLDNVVNSYHFMDELSGYLKDGVNIVTDMGTSLTCTHAALKLKKGQRLITSTGLGEMGFGLPCALGVAFGARKDGSDTVFIGAEGSLMMNLQEFQTLVHHKLPIKIFILNNNAYLTIFHTENALFGPNHLSACTNETGVSFPDLKKVMAAFGIEYRCIRNPSDLKTVIPEVLNHQGPILCDVFMPQDQFLGPKSAVKVHPDGSLFSPPLEDLFPFIDPNELEQNMIAKKAKG